MKYQCTAYGGAGMERRDPVGIGDERTQLTQFLDYQRATVLMKTDGPATAIQTSAPPAMTPRRVGEEPGRSAV
jgi:hypothetical protein